MSWLFLFNSSSPVLFDDGTPVLFNNGSVVYFSDDRGANVLLTPFETVLKQIKSTMPKSWFPSSSGYLLLDSALAGFTWCTQILLYNIESASKQTRIRTCTGGFLDIVANDFFGDRLLRKPGEYDDTYTDRIIKNIFVEKVTFNSVFQIIKDMVLEMGGHVTMYEYGMLSTSVIILMEDDTDIITEDDYQIDSESHTLSIPDQSYPIGLNIEDAAVRYNTDIRPYEALVQITGLAGGDITLEDDTVLDGEDGITFVIESLFSNGFQSVYETVINIKPIGTVIWVDATI